MKPKKIAGLALQRAILMNEFLPDHPEPFRRQQVLLAVQQAGYVAPNTTIDDNLYKLVTKGYLERSAERYRIAEGPYPFYWYRFARADRTSDRPKYRPGEERDLLS